LVAKHLFTSLEMKGLSLIGSLNSASSLVMVLMTLVTDFRIWLTRRLLEAEMLFFLRTKPLKILKRKKSQNKLLIGSLMLSLNLLSQLLIIGEM